MLLKFGRCCRALCRFGFVSVRSIVWFERFFFGGRLHGHVMSRMASGARSGHVGWRRGLVQAGRDGRGLLAAAACVAVIAGLATVPLQVRSIDARHSVDARAFEWTYTSYNIQRSWWIADPLRLAWDAAIASLGGVATARYYLSRV